MTKNDPLKDAMAILGMTKHESLIIAIKDIMAILERLSDGDSMRALGICVKSVSKSARIIDANDTVEQWLAVLMDEALKIDHDTAAEWQFLQAAARSWWIASRAQMTMS
jgi:hypothetical protein